MERQPSPSMCPWWLASRLRLLSGRACQCPAHHWRQHLPVVLRRSEAEAALLVSRLPPGERQRLRTTALCLARAQRVHGLQLPLHLLHPLLLAALNLNSP